MMTPDECVAELQKLQGHYEMAANHFRYGQPPTQSDGPISQLYTRRAFALKWLLEQNAYDVTESEIVT